MTRLEWLAAGPAEPALYASAQELIEQVAGLGGAVGWLSVPSPAECRAWVDARRADVAAGARVLLAYSGGDLIGCGRWSRPAHPVQARNAVVQQVMTHPRARGRGVGRQVTAALIADARDAGVEWLTLEVRGNNHSALRLYRELGFTEWGRLPDALAVHEHRFDRVLLGQLLGRPAGVISHRDRSEGPGRS